MSTPQNMPNRWLRHLVAALSCGLVLLVGCAQAIAPGEVARLDLPLFDQQAAVQLTGTERAALEHELFSELSLWNRGSVVYPTSEDITQREQRWLAMAQRGFELAHITLSVLQPASGRIYELQRPMQRLVKLAQQGDTGAMCLMSALSIQASEGLDVESYRPEYRKWMEKGAELGHPECQSQLGGRLLLGSGGYGKDLKRGFQLSFAAVEAGYIHDLGGMSLHFESIGFDDAKNIDRLYCWLSIEKRTSMADPMRYLKQAIKEVSPEMLKMQQAQIEKLERWNPEPKECIVLGSGA